MKKYLKEHVHQGSFHELVKSIFKQVMQTSELGKTNNKDFIRRMSESLELLSEMRSTINPTDITEFMYPVVTYIDFTDCRSFRVYLDGITDKLMVASIPNEPTLLDDGHRKGFRFINHISPINNEGFMMVWPEDEEIIIPNNDILRALSVYGYCITDTESKNGMAFDFKSAKEVAEAIYTSMEDKKIALPKGASYDDFKRGLGNIVFNSNIINEYEGENQLSLIFQAIDTKANTGYYIAYDIKENSLYTIIHDFNHITNIGFPDNVFMIFGYFSAKEEAIVDHLVMLDSPDPSFTFIDVITEMYYLLEGDANGRKDS